MSSSSIMNRSHTFVNSLKWWPIHGQSQTTTDVAGGGGGGGGSIIGSNTTTNNKTTTYGSSSVAVQKLRESKWFKPDEQRIFCAVVECGFIVEVRRSVQDENEEAPWFGIVTCKTTKENKPKPETIEILWAKIRENGTFKIIKFSLEDIWNNGFQLRINNFGDKENRPHCEKDIRNQISFARKAKHSLWHNNKHFVYWCRYGIRQQDIRKRQMSECVQWGSVGMNAGIILVMNKHKSYSASK